MKLPPLTKEPIRFVDSTPDNEYPLRILRAYRADCDCQWEYQGEDKNSHHFYEMMNEYCRKRAKILDIAISILENAQNDLERRESENG